MKKLLLPCVFGLLFFFQSYSFAQSRADCLTCHADSSLTKEKEGKQISLFVSEGVLDKSPHKKLVCVACHTGFDANNVPHKEKITPVNCLTCHSDVPIKHTFHPQLSQAILSHKEPDVSCKDCHGTHDVVSPKVPGSKFNEANLTQSCGECHADVKDNFLQSAHGIAATEGVKGAPTCLYCHRTNVTGIDAKNDSLSNKVAQVKLCLSCHLDNPDVKARTSPTAGFIAAYEKSIHGSTLLGGNPRAANCVDCHGNHEMKKGSEPTSLTNKENIPHTCGKCHDGIAKEFNQSVHGVALAKGITDAPNCTSCHGEHTIFLHNDPRSPVAVKNLSSQVCSPCHSSLALSAKYGLANDRFKTFSDSYHGLASRGGSIEVANCASCHGSHSIKPSSDSTSSISKANLAKTCGRCHPGANQRFGIGAVHVTMAAKQEPILYWIATLYIILIVVVIGGMFLHNLLDFVKKSKRQLMLRRGLLPHENYGHSLYLRMTLSERLQHLCLLLSFITLVITGFMLRFPDAWWVQGIRRLSDGVFDARSIIHRVAAVVMVAASLYHIFYLAATKRGRELFIDLLPRLQDATDAISVLKYNLGISKIKPKFGRFSYIEKSEYWALVWGTLVMAATGVIMWFDNTFIGILTKLGYDISRTIHYYEAWLATLAIIIWHIYFVIFNPDIYPINLAFWKGTLTEEEMADEHPLELEKIQQVEIMESIGESDAQNENNHGSKKSKNIRSEEVPQ
ncbi:MAG: cytochrome b/b6 domain-containing protein [Bacteroidota bacterium]